MHVLGLPLHPLAALGALAVVVSGKQRDRYGWLVAALRKVAVLQLVLAARLDGRTRCAGRHAVASM